MIKKIIALITKNSLYVFLAETQYLKSSIDFQCRMVRFRLLSIT